MAVQNGYVYVCGEFTAINNNTNFRFVVRVDDYYGLLDTAWNPGVDGEIEAMTIDDQSIYVAGSFTNLGGYGLTNLAKINLRTGMADTNWHIGLSSKIACMAVDGGNLFVGGAFTTICSQAHGCLARLNKQTAAVDPAWRFDLDAGAAVLKVAGNVLYVGGTFTNIAGYWCIYLMAGRSIEGEWGAPGWTPVSGDFDGDGKSDVAVYRDGYWCIYLMAGRSIEGGWGWPGWTPVQ